MFDVPVKKNGDGVPVPAAGRVVAFIIAATDGARWAFKDSAGAVRVLNDTYTPPAPVDTGGGGASSPWPNPTPLWWRPDGWVDVFMPAFDQAKWDALKASALSSGSATYDATRGELVAKDGALFTQSGSVTYANGYLFRLDGAKFDDGDNSVV